MPDGAKFVSDIEFHKAVEKGSADGLSLRKGFVCNTVKMIDVKKRIVDFIISTEAVDRMKDVILVAGWQLKNYKNNPVVLFAHDHRQPPIAKALSVKKNTKDKTLTSRAQFMSPDTYAFAETIFQMYVQGFMKATSVGFMPLQYERVEEDESRRNGINFLKSELLEYSAVPIPANPEALIAAKGSGIDIRPMKEWAQRVLDEWTESEVGLILPREAVINIYKQSGNDGKIYRVGGADRTRLRKENLQRLRSSMREELKNIEEKAAISYGAAHAGGTPKAPKSAKWDGGAAMMAANSKTYHIICAWVDKQGSDDDGDGWPDQRQAYKLPHHNGAGNHSVVWRGVANAAARLPNTNIPAGDVKGVQAHLGRHYKEFDETAPWDNKAEAWNEYIRAARALQNATEVDKDMLDAYFGKLVELGFIEERASFKAESVLFPKSMWKSADAARKWASDHKFRTDKLDETQKMYRFRQEDPNKFKRLRTICINPPGKVNDACKVLLIGGQMKAADEEVTDDFVLDDIVSEMFEFADFDEAVWADASDVSEESEEEEEELEEVVDSIDDEQGENKQNEGDRELTTFELMDALLLVADGIADKIDASDGDIIKTRKDKRMVRAVVDAIAELANKLSQLVDGYQKNIDTETEDSGQSDSDDEELNVQLDDIEGDDGEIDITDEEVINTLKEILPSVVQEILKEQLAAQTGKVD